MPENAYDGRGLADRGSAGASAGGASAGRGGGGADSGRAAGGIGAGAYGGMDRGARDADMGVGMRGTVSLGDLAAGRADTVGITGGGSVTAGRDYGLGDYGTIAGRALGLASGPTGSPQGRSTFSGQPMVTIDGRPAAVVSTPQGLQMVDPTVAGTRAGGQTYGVAPTNFGMVSPVSAPAPTSTPVTGLDEAMANATSYANIAAARNDLASELSQTGTITPFSQNEVASIYGIPDFQVAAITNDLISNFEDLTAPVTSSRGAPAVTAKDYSQYAGTMPQVAPSALDAATSVNSQMMAVPEYQAMVPQEYQMMAPPASGLASLAPTTSLSPGTNRPGVLGSFAKGLQHDVSMGITALSGGFSPAKQEQALRAKGYTQPEIDSYFARSAATAARNAANAGMGEGPGTAGLTASTATSGTSSTPAASTPAATTSSNMAAYRNTLASRFGNTPMTAATANAPTAAAQQRNTQAEFNYYMNLFGGQQPYTQMIR